MPGLAGFVQHATTGAGALIRTLLEPLHGDGGLARESAVDPEGHWGLGRAHLGVLEPDAQLDGRPIQVLFHGDLSNASELQSSLREDPHAGSNAPANIIRRLYERHDVQGLSQLRGAYCLVILDEGLRRLILVSDPIGSYPLYWYHGAERFTFSSALKSALRDPLVPRALDPRAIADFLTFGVIFGAKTPAAGVQLLPPGSTLTYSWNDGRCVVDQYFHVADLFTSWTGSHQAYIEELTDAFQSAVRRALSGDHRFGLSLSGGLDSRAVLAMANHDLSTFTLGVKGCADEVIAIELARISGVRNTFSELNGTYLINFQSNFERMVSLTDGMYLSHGLTEILALEAVRAAECSVLLRGHGGELAKASLAWPFQTDAQIYAMRDKSQLIAYLLHRASYVSRDVTLRDLLMPQWYEPVEGQPRRSLEESLDQVDLSPPDLCTYLYLMEQHRRLTVPSLELFRHAVEVRLPFTDTDFLAALFRAPARWRDKCDIHQAIIRDGNPRLLRVRNSNTGAPAGAGPTAEVLHDKLNTVLKRLNVYGYRHYHSFERWMRRSLLESVEAVLLDERTLSRGVFREDALKRLVAETREGRADRVYLLEGLLVIELWQRENL